MIFFLVMPGFFGGFGNYFVPIFQGSPEVVYPRVNNFSILILSLSYLFLILSLISDFGGGTGWTLYPPLSTSFMSLSPSSTGNLIFGLLMSGISSCLTSLNFWTTILNLRSYYLTLKTMPLFPWALLITGGMLLFTLPILTGALLMVLADLHSNTLFFDPLIFGIYFIRLEIITRMKTRRDLTDNRLYQLFISFTAGAGTRCMSLLSPPPFLFSFFIINSKSTQ